MAYVFEMPEIGEGVVEGEVVDWKIAVGDVVDVDQPLCEVMTDKATVEIPSPKAGRVIRLHGDPGDIIPVHAPLVELDLDGSTAAPAPKAPAPAPAPAPKAPAPKAPAPAAAAPAPAPAPAAPVSAASEPTTRGRTKATPAVRRHAREAGIDIERVPGTGRSGRVTHSDLEAFGTAPVPEPKAMPAMPQITPSGHEERVKIIGLRRKIAQQMVRAKQTAPHFTYVEEIDGTKLVDLRSRLKARAAARGVKLTYIPFLMKACSVAFRDFPNVNAVMDEEAFELVVKGDHNIGISTDTPNGLFVPVVKNVEQKSILQIAVDMNDVVERTRAGRASLDELSGGTFTITSVGSIGGAFATPILNVPEVSILGFNSIRDRAVVIDGEIVVRKMFYLSPSFDHRVIDGAVAARFVARLKELLEEPESLLLELS